MQNNRTRLLIAIAALIAIVIAFLVVFQDGAKATSGNDETCVPSEAIPAVPAVPGTPEVPAVTHDDEVFDHWQRYSWTGGPVESDIAPAFPSDDWQANVAGDPHGIGVEGAYFVSHGNSGKGDWFYLEAVTKTVVVVDTPAVPAVPGTPEIPAVPAVVCPETPTETPSVPTETPSVVVETPIVPTETPTVPTVISTNTPGPLVICGITITPPAPGMPVPRDILCTLEEIDEVVEKDPVIKKETRNTPQRMIQIRKHESGLTTQVVVEYPADAKEEGF